MKIIEETKDGKTEKTLTAAELLQYANHGNTEAIRELIKSKGGFSALTKEEQDKVILAAFGEWIQWQ